MRAAQFCRKPSYTSRGINCRTVSSPSSGGTVIGSHAKGPVRAAVGGGLLLSGITVSPQWKEGARHVARQSLEVVYPLSLSPLRSPPPPEKHRFYADRLFCRGSPGTACDALGRRNRQR